MTAKNLVMCTLTGFYGHDIMGNIKRATVASAVLNMLIKDAPLWFEVLSFLFCFLLFSLIFINLCLTLKRKKRIFYQHK